MKAYHLVTGALAFCLVAAGVRLFPFAEAAGQPRIILPLGIDQKASVRSEMRKLMASVADIVEAIDGNDFGAVEAAARRSGMKMAAQVEVSLKSKLPGGFMKMGKSVHVGFDEIADAAQAEGPDKKARLMSLLAVQLQRCVACHDTYGLK